MKTRGLNSKQSHWNLLKAFPPREMRDMPGPLLQNKNYLLLKAFFFFCLDLFPCRARMDSPASSFFTSAGAVLIFTAPWFLTPHKPPIGRNASCTLGQYKVLGLGLLLEGFSPRRVAGGPKAGLWGPNCIFLQAGMDYST